MPIQTNGTQSTQTESHIKTCCISLFVVCIIVGFADIVISIVAFLSSVINTVGQLILSLIPALLGILVGFLLLISVGKKHVEEQHRIDSINTLASNTLLLEWGYATRKRNKMMSPEEVSRIEKSVASNSTIYLMTSSFLLERMNSDFRNAMAKNINRGVKYRYIIPENRGSSDGDSFAQAVYAVFAEKENGKFIIDESKRRRAKEIIKANQVANNYFFLTIAYYVLKKGEGNQYNNPEDTAVIVKLTADSEDEANDKGIREDTTQMSYAIPQGKYDKQDDNLYHFEEHYRFYKGLKSLYAERESANKLSYSIEELKTMYPDGVVIDENRELPNAKL